MTDDSLEDRVKRVLTRVLGAAEDRLADTASIREDLHADSLDEVEIVVELEAEFGIEITDDEGETMLTVADVIRVARQKVSPC